MNLKTALILIMLSCFALRISRRRRLQRAKNIQALKRE